MSAVAVGTAPIKVGSPGEAVAVQNLGPGDLYLDTRSDVTEQSGIRVVVGAYFEFPRDLDKSLYAVATAADTDVRVMVVG